MYRTTFALFNLLLLFILIGLLQAFLAKRAARWPGLVLPLLTFLYSLLYPLNMAAPQGGVDVGFILSLFVVWAVGNIPTVILLAIYFGCRGRQRRRAQLDKMNIQDLD